jgi:hypothetical protein
MVICCDGRDYWRKSIFPLYKQNRKKDHDKSVFNWDKFFEDFNQIKTEIKTELPFNVVEVYGCEADDVIAVISKQQCPHQSKIIIISSDKDLIQIQETVNNITNQTNEKKYLVYKNFDLSTNYAKRRYVDSVTGANGIPMDSNRPFSDYVKIISESCFVIAPPGNVIDCHRIWECLKLKTIPIVEYHECFSQFTHLPILFIDNWERITPDFLRSNLSMLESVRKALPELEIDYWRNLICTE